MLILERPWTRQPQQVVGIDWGNPLSAGLIVAFSPATPQINLALKNAAAIANPTFPGYIAASSKGLAFRNEPSIDGRVITTPVAPTVMSSFVLTKTTGASNNQIAVYGRSGATNIWAQTLDYSAGNYIRRYTLVGVASYDCPPVAVFSGFSAHGVSSRTSTTGGLRQYIDGAFVSSHNTGAKSGGDRVIIGSGYYYGSVVLSLQWTRYLSDAEHAAIAANPWQIFQPRRIYIPTATAATGAPTITALSAINITATSAQPQITYA